MTVAVKIQGISRSRFDNLKMKIEVLRDAFFKAKILLVDFNEF
jgi:hypothetical protein